LIGQSWREVPLDQIGRYRQLMRRIRCRLELAFGLGPDIMQRHELSDRLLAHPNAVGQQQLSDVRPAILALDLRVDGLDVGRQGIVTDPTTRLALIKRTSRAMLVVAAGTYLRLFAQHLHGLHVPMQVDEIALHVECFAKYAEAFFTISSLIWS
jgi:hypothetical protein